MSHPLLRSLVFSVVILIPAVSNSEELPDIFKRVQEFVDKQNFPKALEELSWAKQEIEKKNAQKLQTLLPDELNGYKAGKAEVNTALGMLNIERKYTGADGSISISLTGGGAAGAAGGLGGGLAQIGRMAAMFGAQAGQETVRISGRTASLEQNPDRNDATLSIFLDSGSIIKFEGKDGAKLKAFAEALKIDSIDSYLRGSAN